MANVNIDVQLKVIGDGVKAISGATKELIDLEKQSKSVAASFGRISEVALGNIFANLAQGGVSLLSNAFSDLVGFVNDSIDAAIEAEDSVNKLNFALASSGNFTQQASEEFQEFASQLQNVTKFEDDAIISTGAFIAQLTGLSGKALQEATVATADLATALGKDLDSAAQLLARSLEGNVSGLNKLGIEVKKGTTDAETFTNVINALNEKGFGGASQNAAQTFSGSITKLGNTFNSFQEQVGFLITKNTALIPIFNEVTSIILSFTKALADNAPVIKAYIADAIGLGAGVAKVGSKIADLFINTLSPIGNLDLFQGTTESLKRVQDAAVSSASFVGPVLDKQTQSVKNQTVAVQELTAAELIRAEQGRSLASASNESAAAQFQFALEQEKLFLDQKIINQQTFFENQKILREAQFQEEQLQLEAAVKNKDLTQAQADKIALDRKKKLDQDIGKINAARLKADEEENRRKTQLAADVFGNLSSLTQTGNKTLFEIGKAAAVAQATIQASLAITKALAEGGPFLGPILAASIAIKTGVEISKIAATKLATGLTEVPSGFSGDTFPALLSSGERVVSANQNQDLKEFIVQNDGSRSVLEQILVKLDKLAPQTVVNIGGREIVNVLNDEIASGMVLNTA